MSCRKSSSAQSRVPSIALFPKCISAGLARAVGWLRAWVWSFISFAQSCVFVSPGICSFNQSCGQMGVSSPGLKLQIYTKKSASHMCFHLPFNTNKANTCLYQEVQLVLGNEQAPCDQDAGKSGAPDVGKEQLFITSPQSCHHPARFSHTYLHFSPILSQRGYTSAELSSRLKSDFLNSFRDQHQSCSQFKLHLRLTENFAAPGRGPA